VKGLEPPLPYGGGISVPPQMDHGVCLEEPGR